MSVLVKAITKPVLLGEGPHWSEKTQALYFVDIRGFSIHKYDPKTNSHTSAVISDKEVSVIIPVKNEADKYVVTTGCSVGTVTWDGVSEKASDFKELLALDESSDMRINDGKVSPSGVLLAGTMLREIHWANPHHRLGHLYSFKNLKTKKLLDNISISNGLAWSLDEKLVYYIDSVLKKVNSYKYDKETAELSDEKTVFDFEKNNIDALPDGMTIDTDGNLWIACYGGGCVLNVDPRNGKLLKTINLPALYITSVAFGGANYEDLYVTSAQDEGYKTVQPNPEDGCTFLVTGTGARGLPPGEIQL